MCSIDVHEKVDPPEQDDGSIGGVYPLPSNSTTEALVLLGTTIYFIGCWLKDLEQNVLERCHMYVFTMNKLFHKIPVELPKQPISEEKRQPLLHGIGCGWYVKKLVQKIPPLKKKKLSKNPKNRRIK